MQERQQRLRQQRKAEWEAKQKQMNVIQEALRDAQDKREIER